MTGPACVRLLLILDRLSWGSWRLKIFTHQTSYINTAEICLRFGCSIGNLHSVSICQNSCLPPPLLHCQHPSKSSVSFPISIPLPSIAHIIIVKIQQCPVFCIPNREMQVRICQNSRGLLAFVVVSQWICICESGCWLIGTTGHSRSQCKVVIVVEANSYRSQSISIIFVLDWAKPFLTQRQMPIISLLLHFPITRTVLTNWQPAKAIQPNPTIPSC